MSTYDRDQLTELATQIHDEDKHWCERKYLWSCSRFQNAIFEAGRRLRETTPAARQRGGNDGEEG